MNDKEFAKAQASIMNKKTKLVQLKDDRAEACKKINEIEQERPKQKMSCWRKKISLFFYADRSRSLCASVLCRLAQK